MNKRPFPEVVDINPRRFTNPITDDDELSFVPMKAVEAESGKMFSEEIKSWSDVKKGYTPFENDDVLFAKITPCMENGKFALAEGLHHGRAAGSTEFHVFRAKSGLLPKYLLFFLFNPALRSDAKKNMRGAVGQLRVPIEFFENLTIPVPSPAEQEQIVSELERQFTHLDAGVETLRRIQRNLRRYRAAVLKAACDCTLVPTEAEIAKQENRAYETGKEFLTHILDERRKQWPGRGRYSEPAVPEVAGLRPLPNGWTWATVEQLTTKVRNGVSTKPTATSGMPILRISAVRPNSVNLLEVRYLSGTEKAYSDFVLETGDVLFTRYNGNPDFVGVCGVVPLLNQKIVHPDKLIRCVPAQGLPSSFLCFMANHESTYPL